jgi:hypothetical protein
MLVPLSGCGKDTSIDDYKVKMEAFYERLSDYDHAINALDPYSDSAVPAMLSYLDDIAEMVKIMNSYQVPEHFYGVDELAKQADEYMTEAVSLFRQAFLAAEYDDNIADAATENYERANLRLRYIAEILRGDIPEEIFTYTD